MGGAVRSIGFGGQSLRVGWDRDETRAVVDLLFGDVPEGRDAEANSRLLRLEMRGMPLGCRLYVDEDLAWRGSSAGALALAALDEALRLLADPSDDGVMFHAAAVVGNGMTLALPGGSGCGKSSLSAWLLRQGFRYLTDELVYVEHSTGGVECFPRPLNVKKNGVGVIQRLLGIDPVDAGAVPTPNGLLVPHRLLNQQYGGGTPGIGLFLFPRFTAETSFEVWPLSKGETGRRLMACLINARNLEEHGFRETSRLARAVKGFELSYGSDEQLAEELVPFLARELGT